MCKVTYRPFDEETDFAKIVTMLGDMWHNEIPEGPVRAAEAGHDFASSYAISTFSQVAVLDGEPIGVILARSGQASAAHQEKWNAIADKCLLAEKKLSAQAYEAYSYELKRTDRIHSNLLDGCNADHNYEATLLIVSASARGLGVGAILISAVKNYLAGQQALSAYLYTDSSCTYTFYDHMGLIREGSHKVKDNPHKIMADEYFIYSFDLAS